MKKITITVFLLFIFFAGQAQYVTVSGSVAESISRQPLPRATVTIKSIGSANFTATIVADKKGDYRIALPAEGFYTMQVSYLGYNSLVKDSVNISPGNNMLLPYFLMLEQKDLAIVKVAAKKPFITMSADKIILNVAQSAIASGGNAYDVLKRAPGIAEQSDNLTFRGKSVNVLINGRPSNLSGEELKTMLGNMQASTVEKVEILPNPSSKYDAQGGSVINIVLAKNKAYGTNYVLTTGAGTGRFASANTGLDINNRNKNINIFGGLNYAHNKQYYDNESRRFLENGTLTSSEYDVRNRNNYSGKFGVDYDISKKTSVGFLINGFANYRRREVNDNSILHYTGNVFDSTANVYTTGNAVTSNLYLNGYLKKILDSTGKVITFNGDYFLYSKKWDDQFLNSYYDENGRPYLDPNYLRDNSPGQVDVYSFTVDFEQPSKKGKWETGLKSSYTTTDNNVLWETNTGLGWTKDLGKTNHFIFKENVNAFYVNRQSYVKKWTIETGVRFEQTNTVGNSVTNAQTDRNSYFDFFPNISLSKDFTTNRNFNLTYRKTIQRFGFDYVNPFIIYQNAYAYRQGNPNLKAQKDHQFSATFSLAQSILIGANYMHSIKALGASYKASATTNISTYDNFNSSDIYYFFINYNSAIFSFWQSNIVVSSGVYKLNLKKEDELKNKSQKSKPFVVINCQNNFDLKKGWSAEMFSSLQSGVTSGIFVSKGYFTIDAGLSKNFQKGKILAKLSCTDIFNTRVSDLDVNYQGVVQNKYQKTESRFLNFSVKYRFGNKNVKRNVEKRSKISDIKNRIN